MWLDFYARIFELDIVKRPTDDMIADDRRLDEWLEEVRLENKMDLIDFYKSQEEIKRANRSHVGDGSRASRIVG